MVGIARMTTYDQYGPAGARAIPQPPRLRANPIHRWWSASGWAGLWPGAKTVFLTQRQRGAPYSRSTTTMIAVSSRLAYQGAKPTVGPEAPPQKTARAVRVHVVLTLLMFALATAYRLQCEARETGTEPVGWQRWRRQLLQQNRDKLIAFAQSS